MLTEKWLMKLPDDIHQLLMRRFQSKQREWLGAQPSENKWPIEIKLGVPTEQAALKQITGIQIWVAAWHSWQGAGRLVWCERCWKTLGIQRLPEKLLLQSPEDVTAWIGETPRWRQAIFRYQTLIANWPALTTCLPRHFDMLADYSAIDFQRLSALLTWFNANPNSNLYPRQLPIVGIDSKWLEKHKGLLTKLVAAIQGDTSNDLNFYQRCGLKTPPLLIRMRILDQTLRTLTRGLGDITAPVEDLANLNLPATHVFIVENLQTGLAMSDLPGAVVFIRLGYNVDVFDHLPWVAQAKCIYWGDLDTHGFAILHQARSYLPDLQSIMMDEETLFQHKVFWGHEEKQTTAHTLALLTKAEQAVYQHLKQQYWGQNIRLEQERINWDFAWNKLQLALEYDNHYSCKQ